MGLEQSKQTVCPTRKLTGNDFQLCIDAAAFEMQVLHATNKSVRVSHLDINGRWQHSEDEYVKNVENQYFSLNAVSHKLTVIKDVTYLYLNPRVAPKRILCEVNGVTELYVDMHLLKQYLKPGTYDMPHDAFLLTPDGILLINFPEPENRKRAAVPEIYEQSLVPIYNFFASSQLF